MDVSILHTHPQDSYENARQKIDEEIAQLEMRIISLKSARNDLAPISRLHNEVLQELFVVVCRSSTRVGWSALILSWICRKWRILAKSAATLWSHIDFMNPPWVQEALLRTRNCALIFDLRAMSKNPAHCRSMIPLCLGNLSRTKALAIRCSSFKNPFPSPSCPLWTTPAPILVKLELNHVELPQGLFSGTCPSLRSLSLSYCSFDWDTIPAHAGMEKFRVDGPRNQTSLSNIMDNLRRMASTIKELSLSDVLSPELSASSSNPLPQETRLSLQQMKSFAFEDPNSRVVASLLDQISLPQKIDLYVGLRGGAEQFDALRALVSCRNIQRWPVANVEIHVSDESVSIRIQEDWIQDTQQRDECDENDKDLVTISVNTFGFPELSSILPLFDILPLRPIISLTFTGGYFYTHDSALLNYFSSQGTVECLDIRMSFFPTLVGVMDQEVKDLEEGLGPGGQFIENLDEEQIESMRSQITFHQLQRLSIHGHYQDDYRLSPRFYVSLQRWLVWRDRLGLRLKSLMFTDMNVLPDGEMFTLFGDVVEEYEQFRAVELAHDVPDITTWS
ncbi:hypothetical protein BDN72DRAFT_961330 [Pluteus cervinus]|uniref:Uncharacterized protein n=1 Tax=Pluteus cervinus TaxID=181527 RepID=A0ACD3AMW7_9AGAR|nr:hypothetical protein BDN72DRAFT_961330 [Pluteus cervinus]